MTGAFLVIVVIAFSTLSLKVPSKLVSILQTCLALFFSTLWGKVAKKIVILENKRTQARFNQSLTMRLAFVKLFIFFFPLVRIAFLAPVAQRQCGKEVSIREKFFNETSNNLLELGITPEDKRFDEWMEIREITTKNFVDYAVMVLTDFDQLKQMVEQSGQDELSEMACFRGCYPKECELQRNGTLLRCSDTCYLQLKKTLNLLYLSHTICMLAFIVVPMVQVRWAARAEIAKGAVDVEGEADYSLLQYQEKCHILASYEYESWGGSYVEDFMEVVLGFSVLVCFSLVSPLMAVIGFVFQMFEYRLLAFRMVWVTCRPYPAGSEGIGEWLNVLDVVLYLAICMNSLLLVTVLRTRLDFLDPMTKLLSVLLTTLGFVVLKVLMRVSLHEQPAEILEATDANHEFLEELRLKRATEPMNFSQSAPTCKGSSSAPVQLGVGEA